MSTVIRVFMALMVLALLAVSAAVTPGSAAVAVPAAAAQGTTKFVSPYNTAFTVEAEIFTRDRTPAVSFSNHFAGYRQVDPLVSPGQAKSHHLHAWLGNRLAANTNVNRLYDAPADWESGSNATGRNRGFAGQTVYNGKYDGYASGVWWPAIWDAPPGKTPVLVTYLDGISSYYVARRDHGDSYLEAYPNGLGFLIDEFLLKMRPDGRTFNMNFFGPMFWDGRSLTSGDHRSHLSYTQSSAHPVPIPQFQTFVKARLGYPNDSTPLEDRIKFGDPGAWTEPHLDYVAGFRQSWFHQWLLDLGPNWGHPDNQLRKCGVSMPGALQRRKLEGVRMPLNISSGGQSTCSAGNSTPPPPAPAQTTTTVKRTSPSPVSNAPSTTSAPRATDPTMAPSATSAPSTTNAQRAKSSPDSSSAPSTSSAQRAKSSPDSSSAPSVASANRSPSVSNAQASNGSPSTGPATTADAGSLSGESVKNRAGAPTGGSGSTADPLTAGGESPTADAEATPSTEASTKEPLIVVLSNSSADLATEHTNPTLSGQDDVGADASLKTAEDTVALDELTDAVVAAEGRTSSSGSVFKQRTLVLPPLAASAMLAIFIGLWRRSRSWS